MQIHLLGPVEVSSGNGSVALGGPKPRALLAMLALVFGTGDHDTLYLGPLGIGFSIATTLAVLGLVAAGLGIALLPGLSLQSAAIPEEVRVVTLPPSVSRVIAVAHRRGARRVPSIRVLTEAVAAVLPDRHGLEAVGPQGAVAGPS